MRRGPLFVALEVKETNKIEQYIDKPAKQIEVIQICSMEDFRIDHEKTKDK